MYEFLSPAEHKLFRRMSVTRQLMEVFFLFGYRRLSFLYSTEDWYSFWFGTTWGRV